MAVDASRPTGKETLSAKFTEFFANLQNDVSFSSCLLLWPSHQLETDITSIDVAFLS